MARKVSFPGKERQEIESNLLAAACLFQQKAAKLHRLPVLRFFWSTGGMAGENTRKNHEQQDDGLHKYSVEKMRLCQGSLFPLLSDPPIPKLTSTDTCLVSKLRGSRYRIRTFIFSRERGRTRYS